MESESFAIYCDSPGVLDIARHCSAQTLLGIAYACRRSFKGSQNKPISPWRPLGCNTDSNPVGSAIKSGTCGQLILAVRNPYGKSRQDFRTASP